MLSVARNATAARPRGGAVGPRTPPLLRRSVAVRFKEGDREPGNAEEQAAKLKEIRKAFYPPGNNAPGISDQKQQAKASTSVSTASPNTDPGGVNQPAVDISDVPVKELGKLEVAPLQGYRAPGTWLLPAFTRRREVMAGRLAMLGFAAALGWEILNPSHPGPLAAASLLTGYSTPITTAVFLGVLAHGAAGAAWPGSATYSPDNQRDIALRPKGPPDTFFNPLTNPFSFLGISRQWGFTKKNDLFQGRLTMLGFLAACLGEVRTGDGILAQVAHWTGNVPTEAYFSAAGRVLIAWSVFSLGMAWVMGNLGEIEGDESVY